MPSHKKPDLEELDHWHANRLLPSTFEVYVGTDPAYEMAEAGEAVEAGVEHFMADRLERNLAYLARLDPKRPVLVHLASAGGDWYAGMQMFSALLYAPNPITVLGSRHCRSMTSLIPLAADKFIMRPPTQYMIHHGMLALEVLAGEQFDTEVEEAAKFRKQMLDIYACRLQERGPLAGRTVEEIHKDLNVRMRNKVDVYWSTPAAQRFGWCDEVQASTEVVRAKVPNQARREALWRVMAAL